LQASKRVASVDWKANGAAGVGDAAGDGLTNPPRGVGGELESFAPVKLFDGMHEAQIAFLDEIEQRKTRRLVLLGNRDHEAKVGLHELPLGACAEPNYFAQFAFTSGAHARGVLELLFCSLAFFDFFGEADFVVFGEEYVLADIGEIETYEIFFVSIDAIFGHCVPPRCTWNRI